jgi:hypothetical protein
MEGNRFLLLALTAPGSIEADIGRLQSRIFSEHGLASAAALAPLIPVCFLPIDASLRGLLLAVDRSIASPYRVETGRAAWEAGALYLCVDTGGLWEGLRAGARSVCAPASGSLFPVFEGFFLGCVEATDELRQTIRPSQPQLGFTSATLALIRIVTHGGTEEWWREVCTEIVEERPLRGSRRGGSAR